MEVSTAPGRGATAEHRGPPPWKLAATCAVVAAVVATVLVVFGPAGGDRAAHDYQRWLFREHGLTLWNNYWYAGRYSFVTYSVLYYPVVAAVGIGATAIASVSAAAGAYAILVARRWGTGARLSAYAFAVVWAAAVLGAAFPFLLGATFAIVALAVADARGRAPWAFPLLSGATLATSPVAFVLLAICVAAVAVARWRRPAWGMAVPIAVLATLEVLMWRAFPDSGRYPFATSDVLYVTVFCCMGLALARRVPGGRLLRSFFGVYLAAGAVAFLVPSPLGGNIVRLRLAALPIAVLVLTLRRWRPLLPSAAALVATGIWTLTPAVGAFTHADAQVSAAVSYWAPVVTFLEPRLRPGQRVEVVDTEGHWGAVYLPQAGIPLVRGWFRQQDFPTNALLYEGRLDAAEYRAWLDRLAVAFVVVPHAAPDYSSRREAELVRSGTSGLRRVARVGAHVVYAVPSPAPLARGPGSARVLTFAHDELSVAIDRPGRYDLALRYTPYWRPSAGCIERGQDGLAVLDAATAGIHLLRFAPSPDRVVEVVVGGGARSCA